MAATWLKRVQDTLRSIVLGPYNAKDPALARLFGANPTASGIGVNENTALNLSAIWCGVVVIAGAVSSLPLDLMKRTSGGRSNKEPFTDHPTYELVHARPNTEMTSVVFRRTLQAHALLWGNGYAEIERDESGRPLALWPLTPDRVYPYREPNGDLTYRVASMSQDRVTYDELAPENILHIPGLGYDGIGGYSVVSKLREALGLGVALERFGAQFFGNGSNMTGVLQHPGKLSPSAHKHLEESLEAGHSQGKARRALVLEEGMTWVQMGVPPDDGQFLETRKFQVTEVARILNLPPHKIKDLERATFSNIEEQNIEFVQDSLMPWLVYWEQELDRKLIRPLERRVQFFKHNVNGLMRGNIQNRFSSSAVGRNWGWLSANDIRDLEDMNSIGAQGDIYLMPGNMLDANGPMPTPGTNAPAPAAPPADDAAPVRHAELQAQLAAVARRLDDLRIEPGITPEMLESLRLDLTLLIQAEGQATAEEQGKAEEQQVARAAEITEGIAGLRGRLDAIKPPAPDAALRADVAALLGVTEQQAEQLAHLAAASTETTASLASVQDAILAEVRASVPKPDAALRADVAATLAKPSASDAASTTAADTTARLEAISCGHWAPCEADGSAPHSTGSSACPHRRAGRRDAPDAV
jgi:HK97 family phage portal protein